MNPRNNRNLLLTVVAAVLLLAVAAVAGPLNGPSLSPTTAVTPVGSTMHFTVTKSSTNTQVFWSIIQSRDDSSEFIDQDGTFHAGVKPGWVMVKVVTSDYGPNLPSYAHVTVY